MDSSSGLPPTSHFFRMVADGGSESPAVLAPGSVVGDYRLEGFLGEGGMGQVWEAHQISLDRRVALKLIRPDRMSDRAKRYFHREARAGGRLSHRGIVAVYAMGEAAGLQYIAQELVEGGCTFRSFLDDARERTELPQDYYARVAAFFRELADAMQVAHDAGVIHRDLKPQNILVKQDDQPAISDFGLARIADDPDLSQTGDFAGSYYYMSPEQVTAKRVGLDHRTDIFSLGVVLYEALTLARPFDGDTNQQISHKILFEDPPDPRTLRSRVPPELAVICGRMLEKDPEHRYPSMREVAEDLGRFLEHREIRARPAGMVRRWGKWARRHPTLAAVSAVGLLALSAITYLWLDAAAAKKRSEVDRRRAEEHAEELAREKERSEVLLAETEASRTEALAALRREREQSYLAKIRAAGRALAEGDVDELARHLAQCSSDARGWEWEYLRTRVERGDVLRPAPPVPTRLRVFGLGPDGFAVADENRIELWRVADGVAEPTSVLGVRVRATAAALSPDGARVAVGSVDGSVAVCEARSGELVARGARPVSGGRVTEHDGIVQVEQFSAGGALPAFFLLETGFSIEETGSAFEVAPGSFELISGDHPLLQMNLQDGVPRVRLSDDAGRLRSLEGVAVLPALDSLRSRHAIPAGQGRTTLPLKLWRSAFFEGLPAIAFTAEYELETVDVSGGEPLVVASYRTETVEYDVPGGSVAVVFDGAMVLDAERRRTYCEAHRQAGTVSLGGRAATDLYQVVASTLVDGSGEPPLGAATELFEGLDEFEFRSRPMDSVGVEEPWMAEVWLRGRCVAMHLAGMVEEPPYSGSVPRLSGLVLADWCNGAGAELLEQYAAVETGRMSESEVALPDAMRTSHLRQVLGETLPPWIPRSSVGEAAPPSRGKVEESGEVVELAFSEDGRTVIAHDSNGVQRAWLTREDELELVRTNIATATPARLETSRNRVSLAEGSYSEPSWSVPHARFGSPLLDVTVSALDAEGRWAATGASDRSILLWDLRDGSLADVLLGHRERVDALAFVEGGHGLVSAAEDGSVVLWDLRPTPEVRIVVGSPVQRIAWSADGLSLRSLDVEGAVRRHLSEDGVVGEVLLGSRWSWAAAGDVSTGIAADGERAWVRDRLEAETGSLTGRGALRRIAADRRGSSVAVLAATGELWLWRPRVGTTARVRDSVPNGPLSFSRDGDLLLVEGVGRSLEVLALAADVPGARFTGHQLPPQAAAFSPDGLLVASVGASLTRRHRAEAFVWSAESGDLELDLAGHDAGVVDVAWHPDGSRLATASEDGTVRIWDATSGDLLIVLRGHEGSVTSLSWSPDGDTLASGGSDGVVRLWKAR